MLFLQNSRYRFVRSQNFNFNVLPNRNMFKENKKILIHAPIGNCAHIFLDLDFHFCYRCCDALWHLLFYTTYYFTSIGFFSHAFLFKSSKIIIIVFHPRTHQSGRQKIVKTKCKWHPAMEYKERKWDLIDRMECRMWHVLKMLQFYCIDVIYIYIYTHTIWNHMITQKMEGENAFEKNELPKSSTPCRRG